MRKNINGSARRGKNTAKKTQRKPGRITPKEALKMFKKADLLDLGLQADNVRKKLHQEGIVSFVVDRNINYTNVCINRCTFCAFWRDKDNPDAYILDRDTLFAKIEETLDLGGTQILIQGGLHPDLDIHYYINLLRSIKERFAIDIHGFSPPEICYIADSADLTVGEALKILNDAGLDSVPGGGAEILPRQGTGDSEPQENKIIQMARSDGDCPQDRNENNSNHDVRQHRNS